VNQTKSIAAILAVAFISLHLAASAAAQKNDKQPTGQAMTRTTTRHENYRLAFGGTLTVLGAPAGSITIEGWQKNEIDISASIELQGPDAAAIDQLAMVNGFAVDVDINHVRILSTGTHDRAFMKRNTKNFPKALIGLPWKIDYHIKVPALTDIEIDGGVGAINLAGVEGALRMNALKSDVNLSLTGGLVSVTVQSGAINVSIPSRGWHGLGAEFRIAAGNVNVEVQSGFSADLNADVLRLGEIKTSLTDLHARDGNSITAHSMRARAGSGGATLNFTVGDGNIVIKQSGSQ
jgi:hypothetical protein